MCSSPRKSLVKGERFIRSEEKHECTKVSWSTSTYSRDTNTFHKNGYNVIDIGTAIYCNRTTYNNVKWWCYLNGIANKRVCVYKIQNTYVNLTVPHCIVGKRVYFRIRHHYWGISFTGMVENKLHIFKAFSNIISLSHCDNRFLNVTFELVCLNMSAMWTKANANTAI